jgi:membrane protein YqaA with SNARE-associated domain
MINKNRKNWIIALILTITIPLLVGFYFLLKGKFELFALFLYTISANSFIPFPHEPAVIYYGKIFPPLTVAVVCGLATCISAWIDIMVLGTFFSHEKIVEFKEKSRVYKIAERFFNQTPFWTMVFAGLTPVPFYPFRVIGIFSGYVRWKYVLSTFIGRTPRYYILAWLGNRYSIETRYIIFLFFIMLIPPMIQIVRKKFPSGVV